MQIENQFNLRKQKYKRAVDSFLALIKRLFRDQTNRRLKINFNG